MKRKLTIPEKQTPGGFPAKMLVERGMKPESLPSSEDVSKVRRRLNSENKKVLPEIK